MGTLVKGQSSVYLVEEVTEGTFIAETLVAQAIEPLQDGLEFNLSREEIERKTLTDTIEAVEPRLGLKTVSGSIPIELKASSTVGGAPRGQILYESLLGGKRSASTTTTTKAVGNTTTFLALEDADISKYSVGDSVLIKKAGAYQVRPVSAKTTTTGASGLTLAIPFASAPGASVVIEKVTTYFHSSASKSFSAIHYLGGAVKETVPGVKAISASLEGWVANETPSMNFSVEGINMFRVVGAPSLDPDFSTDAKVPVIQGACAWLGQTEIDYTELSMSLENAKADLISACSSSGKIGSRKTAFTVTASINPYMADMSVTRWDSFEANSVTSLFTYAFNPSVTAGEFSEIVAIWLPFVKITNMPTADADGVLQDAIELKAFKKLGNDTVFLSFI